MIITRKQQFSSETEEIYVVDKPIQKKVPSGGSQVKPNPVHHPIVDRALSVREIIRGHGIAGLFSPLFLKGLIPAPNREKADNIYLDAAIDWLCRAMDACNGNGVSAAYYLSKGWDVAYPETSGYILSTFLSRADMTGNEDLITRAVKIGEWEISIQSPDGAVFSSPKILNKRIFNTGQVILGWIDLFERTQRQEFLDAAIRAGEWLFREQEKDGTWVKNTHCGARTYHARVDWALLKLENLTRNEQFGIAAEKNLNWVLSCANTLGWFSDCGFEDHLPITHVIDYTLRGLLECHLASDRAVALNIVPLIKTAATNLCHIVNTTSLRGIKGMIPGSFNESWNSPDTFSCLTGNAQIAGLFYRMSRTVGDTGGLVEAADLLISALNRTVCTCSTLQGAKGAIAGSYPFWQGYGVNCWPNWATKFYADALMMKMNSDPTFFVHA